MAACERAADIRDPRGWQDVLQDGIRRLLAATRIRVLQGVAQCSRAADSLKAGKINALLDHQIRRRQGTETQIRRGAGIHSDVGRCGLRLVVHRADEHHQELPVLWQRCTRRDGRGDGLLGVAGEVGRTGSDQHLAGIARSVRGIVGIDIHRDGDVAAVLGEVQKARQTRAPRKVQRPVDGLFLIEAGNLDRTGVAADEAADGTR